MAATAAPDRAPRDAACRQTRRARRAHGAVRRLRDAGPVRRHHRRASVDPRECRPVRRQPHGPAAEARHRTPTPATARRGPLETLVPGDIAGLEPGQLRYSLLLDDEGGDHRRSDGRAAADPPRRTSTSSSSGAKHGDIAHFGAGCRRSRRRCSGARQALLALQGPRRSPCSRRSLPGVAELGFMEAARSPGRADGSWISRSGYTGEDGFEISVRRRAAAVWRRARSPTSGEADRPRRAQFAAARGGPAALRPRSRPRRPRRSRPA